MASGQLSPVEYFFANREEASRRAANFITDRLRDRLADANAASLVVSGGSTPVRCFEHLSLAPLRWAKVYVMMSDERWVPPDESDSNEGLVRRHLLQHEAGAASLLPIFDGSDTPVERCLSLEAQFEQVPRPFACTLLGMGSDGHFASLFPDAPNLAAALEVSNAAAFVPIATAASPHPRISMTLRALLDSNAIVLLIFGAEKREVYEAAASGDATLPIAALLQQRAVPVHVFWAG